MSADPNIDSLGRLRRRPFCAQLDDREIRASRYFETPKGRAPVTSRDGAKREEITQL